MPTASELLQAFFLLSAATVRQSLMLCNIKLNWGFQLLLVNTVPAFRDRYIAYGSRATPIDSTQTCGPAGGDEKTTREPGTGSRSIVEYLLDRLACMQVPHGYFQHFYFVSILSSAFWALQFATKGSILGHICYDSRPDRPAKSMTIDQVALTWALMSLQGVRRLLESFLLVKSSASKMWFVHWLLGVAFYLAVGVAVWVEGSGMPT